MITALLLFFPIFGSLLLLLLKGESVRKIGLLFVLIEFAISLAAAIRFVPENGTQFLLDLPWIPAYGIHLKAGMDGISLLLVLLTTTLVPLIILSTFQRNFKNPNAFYALILFMQAGLIGVFVALDGFLFYVSWEAALIPIYFISAIWGDENRVNVTFKFFVYTIFGSLLMLIAIIYLYLQTPGNHTYDLQAFYNLTLSNSQQTFVFWAFFIAFAIKMPLFPLHTWQPDTYTSAPAAGTMLLSGIMLKMGIYGAVRWLMPISPLAWHDNFYIIIDVCILGVVYGSLIAMVQNDMKRLVAYSSLGHVGLIAAGAFSGNLNGMQGAMIQMISHGINVIGMFFIIDIIEQRTGSRFLRDLGGIASKAPKLVVCFMIILLGTVALPLTNGFIGEFLLLKSVNDINMWYGAIAGLTIILGAVYMFRMFQKSMLGESNTLTETITDLRWNEQIVLYSIVFLIITIGIFPQPILEVSKFASANLLDLINSRAY